MSRCQMRFIRLDHWESKLDHSPKGQKDCDLHKLFDTWKGVTFLTHSLLARPGCLVHWRHSQITNCPQLLITDLRIQLFCCCQKQKKGHKQVRGQGELWLGELKAEGGLTTESMAGQSIGNVFYKWMVSWL